MHVSTVSDSRSASPDPLFESARVLARPAKFYEDQAMFSAFQVCATHSNSFYFIDSYIDCVRLCVHEYPVLGVPRTCIRSNR